MPTFHRLPGHDSEAEALAWCDSVGLIAVVLHAGPGGRVYGLATDPDTAARDLLVRAQGLAETAEGWRP